MGWENIGIRRAEDPANISPTVLLNILIALYNSAYEDITGNAVDEYMALFAQKALQFVRAPDENVFIAREYRFALLYSQPSF